MMATTIDAPRRPRLKGTDVMSDPLSDAWHTIVPKRSDPHGPLPPILVSLTIVTGLVDAFSYLTLGHVFVANMTGNVVFLAFALAGAHGFSIAASSLALATFAVGSLVGGKLVAMITGNRGRLLTISVLLQVCLVAAATIVRLSTGGAGAGQYALIALLAASMGLQNATVRKVAVPDLTTTVLTLTSTAIFADARWVGGPGSRAGRRVVSIAAMFAGALLGAALVLHGSSAITLVTAVLILAVIAAALGTLSRHEPVWSVASRP